MEEDIFNVQVIQDLWNWILDKCSFKNCNTFFINTMIETKSNLQFHTFDVIVQTFYQGMKEVAY